MSFSDAAAAARARLEEFDADRRDRREKRRSDYESRRGTSARDPKASVRIAALRARADDDERGSLANPLPMLDARETARAIRPPVRVVLD